MPKRGYEVHGVAMKWRTEQDWEKMKDPGYERVIVDILPYDDDDDGDAVSVGGSSFSTSGKTLKAVVFVLKDFDDEKLEAPIETLPQERYLRLIAQGMRKYNIDDDYIADQIMSVPYIPSRKPSEFLSFPVASSLPVVSMNQYLRICRRETRKSNRISEKAKSKRGKSDLYFIVGNSVFRVGDHDPGNPVCVMLRSKAHGQGDITFATYSVIFDPDIPECNSRDDILPFHIAWAEDILVDMLGQAGLTATKVMLLEDSKNQSETTFSFRRLLLGSCCSSSPVKTSKLAAGGREITTTSISTTTAGVENE